MNKADALLVVLCLLAPTAASAQGLDLPFRSNRELRQPQDAPAATDSAGDDTAAEISVPQEPLLRVEFAQTEAIPGQPLSLRLTVLVPTFMPEPPVWPTLEAPDLRVRLPEGSTNPTSERIDGETWSGITRHYRLTPMVPGTFAIPAQDVVVTWHDPAVGEPARTTLTTEPLRFAGVLPGGARDLDAFIAARQLELSQTIEGDPGAMVPGDSVTRTVTATIDGTSPMFLPELTTPALVAGLAAYPDEPALDEREARGVVQGTRVERVTFVAEGGGRGTVPAITVQWYDVDTETVETARVDGFEVRIDGPPAAPVDRRALAVAVLAVVLALAVLVAVGRRVARPLAGWLERRRAAWRASEAHAYAALRRVLRNEDHAALRPALDRWASRIAGGDPRQEPAVQAAVLRLGAIRYGQGDGDPAAAWRALADAVASARKAARRRGEQRASLPPLNPTRPTSPISPLRPVAS